MDLNPDFFDMIASLQEEDADFLVVGAFAPTVTARPLLQGRSIPDLLTLIPGFGNQLGVLPRSDHEVGAGDFRRPLVVSSS